VKLCDLALYSPETSSGVKTYIASKIEYARTHPEIEHVVIVPGRRPGTTREGRTRIVVVPGVPSPYPGIRIALNIWKVAAIVRRECPDIIELNCQYTLPWAAFLATRHRPTPIVGVYHTDVPACVRHMARGAGRTMASAAERLTAWYEGLIYRHCTMTVMLNAGMRDRLAALGVERTCCLPCGVDAGTFSPARRDPAWRAGLGIAPDAVVLVYVGRLSAEKELDVLLQAYAQLPAGRFALVIAGDGPDAPAVARSAAVHAGIHYVGHIDSRAELATAYASSDVFVIPGRHETFGMATLEALAAGLPVVGIRESGTATFVPPELGVLTPAGDPDALAAGIRAVSRWPLDDLRARCHDFAADRYSWSRVLDLYFAEYRRMLRERAVAA
jgi:alpha-1,6-mannosyltransferase